MCGQLIGRSLTPGDALHEAGVGNVLVASSRSQAAITLEFARQAVGDVPGIRWSNDGAIHVSSRARIKIISSDARRSLGLGAHARWLFCDEPSAWSPQAGRRLFDSMRTALGKRKCQIVLCGTVRHLRRKALAVGGLNSSRLAAARVSTSSCAGGRNKVAGVGRMLARPIRRTS